jgi:hypothetical protein
MMISMFYFLSCVQISHCKSSDVCSLGVSGEVLAQVPSGCRPLDSLASASPVGDGLPDSIARVEGSEQSVGRGEPSSGNPSSDRHHPMREVGRIGGEGWLYTWRVRK